MRRRLSLVVVAGLLSLALAPMAALAVNPDEVLADPVLEGRAREISAQLRCMVCQNQSIDDSNAELAKDLRVLVRERLSNGDSDEDVINYVVSRYGEFVLLNPRLSWKTYVLWGAPAALLVVGGIAMAIYTRQRQPVGGDRLTEQEEARLQALLSQTSDEHRP